MPVLEKTLRREFGNRVSEARDEAEEGARIALKALGVDVKDALPGLSEEARALRRRLRAHGRALGDTLREDGTQDIARLVREVAYEHWHRMLFARFLAENELLLLPGTETAITLDEAKELAESDGKAWLAYVSECASRMLPQIFRPDDPALALALPPETQQALERIMIGLNLRVFTADDSLGWAYQFWQAREKERVNNSGNKIGAAELPAVTQLFTEDYMVLFLLHNTLGSWWAGKVLAGNPELARTAPDEQALRDACRVGDVEWTYLRFVRDDGEDGNWRPAAGTFEGWPKAAKDVTVLDPCMGSGHFLTFALPILTAFRMAEEGLSQPEAVDAVLRENLHGLELDPRCTQIAAFNLAFTAWRMVGHRTLPRLNLACSGLGVSVSKAEWLKLAEKAVAAADPGAKRDLLGVEQHLLTVGLEEHVKNGLEALYDLFAKAPWLGSLINPRRSGADFFRENFDKLEPILTTIFSAADTDDALEMIVAAQGMAKAAEILGKSFSLTCTNVPYLTRQAQSEPIRKYSEGYFDLAKADLATCFISRALDWAASGSIAVVAPTGWHYQPAYKQFRKYLLDSCDWNSVLRLGPGAFEGISGEVVNVSLCTLTNKAKSDSRQSVGFWIDASDCGLPVEKAKLAGAGQLQAFDQTKQKSHPDQRIILADREDAPALSKFSRSLTGTRTADNPQFLRAFWELESLGSEWEPLQSTVKSTVPFGGREHVIHWQQNSGKLRELADLHIASIQGAAAWGRRGVCVSLMGSLPVTIYTGEKYDMNCGVVWTTDDKDLAALWAFLSSQDYPREVRKIDKQLKLTTATLLKVPFNVEKWRAEAAEKFPGGLPIPYSNDPTQWIFSGFPNGSCSALTVAVARLLGYNWPRQTGTKFKDIPAIESDDLELHSDTDGIVCFTALKGESSAEQRLNALLADAFGTEWSAAKLTGLLADVGYPGRSIDEWLRDGCFTQHIDLFHQRPFIWHIWDGRRDGFNALVNYHRLAAPNGEGRRTLEALTFTYLNSWITVQEAGVENGIDGAEGRLAAAKHLQGELKKILAGEPPYDIFVRWKPLYEQPIGWNPDINDGVRINIRPFMMAKPLGARAANACILRATPRIKWDKDRGKEPARSKEDYPWFWSAEDDLTDFTGGETFDGNRWNSLHYSVAAKQNARKRKGLPE